MLLCRSRSARQRDRVLRRGAEVTEDLAGHVAFEATDDLRSALSFGRAPADVVQSRLVAAHADDDHAVEGGIGLSVAAAIEPVAVGLAAGGRDRAGAAQLGERGLRADA